MSQSLWLTACVCACSAYANTHAEAFGVPVPKGPVVGVLTQDYSGTAGSTYIAASYIKYLESAGARVVPIHYGDDLDSITDKMGKLSGFLFPGGGADVRAFDGVYMKAVFHIWDTAKKFNDAGDYFPIWGTCLGFETIAVVAAHDASVLSGGFDSEDLPLALNLTAAAASSKLLGSAPAQIVSIIGTEAVTMNNHREGVAPSMMATNKALSDFYTVLSTNTDRGGKPFVSTIEGKKYPVWGSQWHPEKNTFEWTDKEAIPHTYNAVIVAQYTANFFVQEARKSPHVYPYADLTKDIIYNYNPVFTYPNGSGFEQCYIWK